MRVLILLTFFFFASHSICQIFNSNPYVNSRDELSTVGVYYLKTDEKTDSLFDVNMEKFWKATPYQGYDPKSDAPLDKEQVVIFKAESEEGDAIICLSKVKHLTDQGKIVKNSITAIYETIGYMRMKGFWYGNSIEMDHMFFAYGISALNSCVDALLAEQVYTDGVINSTIEDYILAKKKTALIKTKTLLIVGNANQYVREEDLNLFGIKYKMLNPKEFQEIAKEDLSEYCVLYGSTSETGNVSIFDFESTDMIYYRRFEAGNLIRMVKSDYKTIQENN